MTETVHAWMGHTHTCMPDALALQLPDYPSYNKNVVLVKCFVGLGANKVYSSTAQIQLYIL